MEDALGARLLNRDHLALVTAPDHPLAGRGSTSYEEVLGHDFVSLHSGSATYAFMMQVASDLGTRFPIRVQVSSFDALCQMVAGRPRTVGSDAWQQSVAAIGRAGEVCVYGFQAISGTPYDFATRIQMMQGCRTH